MSSPTTISDASLLRSRLWPGLAFAATILLSAFLLFQVQPLISKFILPWFGGCPAVWTTCMLFFQVVLFAGYAYAHLAGSRMTTRWQAAAQIAILLAAVALLPIAPGDSWKPSGSEAPAWRILLLLLATVGLPYFVLSTTSPLVQVWFSRSYPGRSPYRLYALSNFGSLAALLSYPFVFEPAFDLPRQSWLWSAAFAAYVILCGICAVWLWGSAPNLPSAAQVDPGATTPANAFVQRAQRPRYVLWVFLPACASLVLLATTNHVCQDVAVVPFLWVVPLSLYLLSFILCFDHPRWYVRGVWAPLAAVAILFLVVPIDDLIVGLHLRASSDIEHDFPLQLVSNFAAMFFICMVCHGELARLRPEPRRLTAYYLCISAGGALGGVFVTLVAPLIFSTFFEWKLGLVISFIVADVAAVWAARRYLFLAACTAIAAGAVLGLLVFFLSTKADSQLIEQARNFYGVVAVLECDREALEDGRENPHHRYIMRHGAINHGAQLIAPDSPEKRRQPLTYYGRTSGIGRAVEFLQQKRPTLRAGVVGLGAGTMAAYARRGDHFRFYEINPVVQRFAEEGGYFTYLSDARQRGATIEVAMGDGRLSLEREPSQQFDLLVLDAFSGDSIPAHLLTREAFAIYGRHMAPGGVIAVDISNQYLNLAPVLRGLAQDAGLRATRVDSNRDEDKDLFPNDWMLLTKDEKLLAVLPAKPPEDENDDFEVPLWTDHYNNLFKILR
jgi:hypothetical protein